jgi:hypothetical protein
MKVAAFFLISVLFLFLQNNVLGQADSSGSSRFLGKRTHHAGDPSFHDPTEDKLSTTFPLLDEGWKAIGNPFPEDKSDESGILRYELTVDSLGKVVEIKLLKSTLSPNVEILYRMNLKQLKIVSKDSGKKLQPISKCRIAYKVEAH